MGRTWPFDPPDLPDLSFLRGPEGRAFPTRLTCPTYLSHAARRAAPTRRVSAALEGEAETDLADALLRPLEVARERRRLQQVRIGQTRAGDVHVAVRAGRALARIKRVEQVEDLADRLDVGATGDPE